MQVTMQSSGNLGLRGSQKSETILNLTFCMLGLMHRTKKGLEEFNVAIKECSDS